MPLQLLSLAVEILDNIVSYVDNKVTLMRCNRLLGELAQRHHYRDLQFTADDLRSGKMLDATICFSSSRDSSISNVVRTLEFRHGIVLARSVRMTTNIIDERLAPIVRRIAGSAKVANKWVDELREEHYHYGYRRTIVFFPLLLFSLQGLQRITLTLQRNKVDRYYLERMLKMIAGRKKPFDTTTALGQLRIVNITGSQFGRASNFDHIIPYLQLPSVENLRTFNLLLNRSKEETQVFKLKPGVSSITYLQLGDCNLPMVDLCNMITACSSLKAFILTWTRKPRHHGSVRPNDFDTVAIVKALSLAANTLESLWIDLIFSKQPYFSRELQRSLPPRTCSLENFHCLKNLKGGLYLFFGGAAAQTQYYIANSLPASIENLYFTSYGQNMKYEDDNEDGNEGDGDDHSIRDLDERVKELLVCKTSKLTSLKNIAFNAKSRAWVQEHGNEISDLSDLAAKAGITLRQHYIIETRSRSDKVDWGTESHEESGLAAHPWEEGTTWFDASDSETD